MLFCVFYLSIFLVVGLQTEPRTSHVTGLSPSHITSPSLTKSSISLSLYRKSLLVCEWNGCCPSFPLMGFLMGELFTCFVLSIVLMDQIYLLPSSCLGSLKFMSIKFPVYPPGNCLAFTLHSCGMCFLPVFGIMSIFPITSFCLYVCVWGGVLCVRITPQASVHLAVESIFTGSCSADTLALNRHSCFVLVLYIISFLVNKTFFKMWILYLLKIKRHISSPLEVDSSWKVSAYNE